MRPLSASDMLQIWEIGQQQHPLDRALTLLACALPEKSEEDLVRLSIGQRDAFLLSLREVTLGSRLESFAECPQCQEALEFTLNVADLMLKPLPPLEQPYTLSAEGFELQFHLPNSQDLAMVVRCENLVAAQQRLAEQCIEQVSQNGVAVAFNQLPASVLAQLSEHIAECDPQAEMLLDLTCPACEYAWQVLFDTVTFFWAELSFQAKRLLQEVHTLARFYGWREAEILVMSAMRRQFHLNLVT